MHPSPNKPGVRAACVDAAAERTHARTDMYTRYLTQIDSDAVCQVLEKVLAMLRLCQHAQHCAHLADTAQCARSQRAQADRTQPPATKRMNLRQLVIFAPQRVGGQDRSHKQRIAHNALCDKIVSITKHLPPAIDVAKHGRSLVNAAREKFGAQLERARASYRLNAFALSSYFQLGISAVDATANVSSSVSCSVENSSLSARCTALKSSSESGTVHGSSAHIHTPMKHMTHTFVRQSWQAPGRTTCHHRPPGRDLTRSPQPRLTLRDHLETTF
jgi:hypothetical protein